MSVGFTTSPQHSICHATAANQHLWNGFSSCIWGDWGLERWTTFPKSYFQEKQKQDSSPGLSDSSAQFLFTVLYRNSLIWGCVLDSWAATGGVVTSKLLPLPWLYKSPSADYAHLSKQMFWESPWASRGHPRLAGKILPTFLMWEDSAHSSCLSLSGPERSLESKARENLNNIPPLS